MLIESVHQMFRGEFFEKPPAARYILDAQGEPVYTCPHCERIADIDACDCLGAEPNCVFCNCCGGEFEF